MIFQYLSSVVVRFLEVTGYPAVVVLMAFESMVLPLPSELVMPFVGFLVAEDKFSLGLSVAASSLGTITGSLASYYMGLLGGDPFVKRFGKYLLLDETALVWTERWFKNRGAKTIFISRFIPVVRHLISIPAGMGRMDIKKFVLYTLLGGTAWNTFLIYCGIVLRENWHVVHEYSRPIDYVVVALMLLGAAWFIYRHLVGGNAKG